MSKILRAAQKLFGSTAGTNQMAEFGSFAAAVPARYSGSTITPAIIQTLSNYLEGWFAAIDGENAPTIEDMNAVCYLFSYQLAYLLQQGVAEWDAATTYFTNSMVSSGGTIYVSLVDTNLNHAVTDTTKWKNLSAPAQITSIDPGTQSPYALGSADLGKTFLINSVNGSMQFNLPAPVTNLVFTFKDAAGSLNVNNLTIHRNGSEKIENLAADYVSSSPYGEWTIACDGTNWFVTGR